MRRKLFSLLVCMSVFLGMAAVCGTSAYGQCTVTLTTDKEVYAYGETVTATLYSDTCHFLVTDYYVFDAGEGIIKTLEPHLITSWPQQVDYYWDQTDSSGNQVPPGTYEIADFTRQKSVTFTILGNGIFYALSLNPTGTPEDTSWKIAELIEINLASCVSTKVGETGAGLDQSQWSLDLSYGPRGILWAVNGTSKWDNLVIINTKTGAGTVVGSTGTLMEGIAFDADGFLYAADSGNNNWDNTGDKLVKIDIRSLTYTVIGLTGYDIDGLAFAPDGTLYGVDSGKLLRVNKDTAEVTLIGDLGNSGFYAITFDPEGIMYAARLNGDIYTVDPGSAQVSFVCSTGFPYMPALEYAHGVIPFPSR
ncbi:MAG: hypothetical protein GTN53_27755 [Candidatus Aminicenantes bacterium]|nr:hypothetical protein [Gammaproteobacteria bacterium]NIO84314.1 hypothetical protein [Candidatus Aminicenantes bacterium]NIQ70280.1 hypothetical protein [Candidatus Aminicenantes bacterium]NIT26311.1 hypothetical protein [Candidatus Aminicenantes bacterium]